MRDLKLVQWAELVGSEVVIQERSLPYCVVLSQECDLEHDYACRNDKNRKDGDKLLQSILIAPAYPAAPFKDGVHLADIQLQMQRHGSDGWKRLKSNQLARYHFLSEAADLQMPDLVVDFKHYFAAPCEVMYRAEYVSTYLLTLEILFRDQLSTRFAHYLSRIGLPEPADSPV